MQHYGIPRLVFAEDEDAHEFYYTKLEECLCDTDIVKKLCDRCSPTSPLNDAEYSKRAQ